MRTPSIMMALGSIAVLSGCSLDLFPEGPGPDRRVTEVHGRFVSQASGSTAITWSPSGEEVTFISADLRMPYAHHLLSGAIRELYTSYPNTEQTYDAALSADGVEWFTTSYNTGLLIRRHSSAGSTVLTDRGTGGPFFRIYVQERGVLVAPDAPVVAFIVSPDSLFLLPRGGQRTLLGSGCAGIVAFSPDRARVLCIAGRGPPSFRVFRTDGGAAEPLVLPPDVATSARSIRWGAQGVQVVYEGYYPGGYLVFDQASSASRPFSPGVKYPESLGGTVSWSSDGRKAAYWTSYCAQSTGFLSPCAVSQSFLYVLDVATGTAKRVAVHTTGTSNAVQVAVSPTGSTVAYTINGGLYLLEVK